MLPRLTLAEILRAAGPAYAAAHARTLRPAQQRALHDLVRCRTPALGGSVYQCDACGTRDYAYHSCRNRHCPTCQADRTQRWLTRTQARLLPCDHYLLTFTVPQELRAVAHAHPRRVYAALLRAAAAAVQTLARDRTWVGGEVGILAVLHTWTRTLEYHPHVHLLVTAGGLAPDGTAWVRPAHARFLMPGYLLGALFRAKLRAALTRAGLVERLSPTTWAHRWITHVQPIGRGAHAVRYLAQYVFHVALTNARLQHFAEGRVTLRYTHARTGEPRTQTLPVDTFLTRFLQHVLPRGFTKVRAFGVLAAGARAKCDTARRLLDAHAPAATPPAATPPTTTSVKPPATTTTSRLAAPPVPPRRCPVCRRGQLHRIGHLDRPRAPP